MSICAAVPHDRVALESVDVNHCDGDLLAGRRPALELAGVRSDEAASRDAVRTGDKELLDHVTAVRKAAIELLQVGRHSSNPIGAELPTSTTTRDDTSASNVDVSCSSIAP